MPEEKDHKPEREIIYVPTAPGYMNREEDEIDLIELWNILWDRKWFIFGFVALCTAAATIVALYGTPTQYKARATLQATQESKQAIVNYLGSNKLIKHLAEEYRLLPELYPQKWDESNQSWKVSEDKVPTLNDLMSYGAFPLQVSSEKNKVKLVWVGQDPHLCFTMLERVIAQLANYTQNSLTTPEQLEIKLYSDELEKINHFIQKALAQSPPNIQSQDILPAVSEYVELQQQINQLRAQDQLSRRFFVLDEPVPPQKPLQSKTKLTTGLSFVLSLFVAVFLVFFLRFVRAARHKRAEASG
jgi:LPS O-antigen subunit length determinant protein (WzzB/FepE family)